MRLIYSFVVVFLIVVCLSCRCQAGNKTAFVNNDKSKFNILAVFPHLGKSHFDVFKPLVEELARRGHKITVISHFPRSESAKAKEPLPTYKDISLMDPKVSVFVNVVDLNQMSHSMFSFFRDITQLRIFADQVCGMGLRNPGVTKLLRSNETFDVILTENFNTDCFLGFSHRFKAPYLSMSSHQAMPWANEDMANEDNPNYIPTIFGGYTRPMSFVDRIKNTLKSSMAKILYDYWFRRKDRIFAEEAFGPDLPDLKEIAKQSQALLVNTHISIHGSRPHVPNVVEVGGLHISSKINPLPKDIAQFLDNAHEGVLYFNMGSMIKLSTIPEEKLDALLKAIGSLPRKVIWKWEADELPRKLDNVMIKKWLPQFDVLNHPNVKCYMGHGGLLGLSEGVYAGVPMVLIPMYGDQFHNAAALKTRGSAVVLEYNNLNEQSLRHALDEVFNNTSYRENAERVSRAYRDRLVTPLETAVWWTEYIARGNGNPYLHSERATLSWYQRYLIDVGLVLIILFAALIYILFRLIKLLLSLLRAVKGTMLRGDAPAKKWKKVN